MIKKINLLNLTSNQIFKWCTTFTSKTFFAKQLMYWIYKRYCLCFHQMSNLSLQMRHKLYNLCYITLPIIIDIFYSQDGVIKWLLNVDGDYIETVYIPEIKRHTLCVSTQIGCMLNCTFCATARLGYKRNLLVSEIIGQVLLVNIWLKNNALLLNKKIVTITNIVFMGMGEPLLNYSNVISSIHLLLDSNGFNISKRRITISTSGIVPNIYKLINNIDVVLSISLHAPNNILRSKIMPINDLYNIQNILEAAKKYIHYSKANRGKISIEYIMLKDINDHVDHAYQLIKILSLFPSKINLIIFNKVLGAKYQSTSMSRVLRFRQILLSHNLFTTIRRIRGNDIKASCGQLFRKFI